MKRSDYFAGRVTHFLKGYRRKKNLTQSELADKLGTTKSTISRIENNQDKQITFVLEILENLANLDDMNLSTFIAYLDSNKVSTSESALFPWQRAVLDALTGIKQSLRLDVVNEVMSQKNGILEKRLNLLVRLNRLPASSIETIDSLVNELSKLKQ